MTDLERSYRHCNEIARSRARNFYYSFLALAKPKRKAMCAVYAFMRRCDDLSDDVMRPVAERRAALEQWGRETEWALRGELPRDPIWPAFADTVSRFRIPHQYFREMIAGVTRDLEPHEIRTDSDLRLYCHQVAGVVGMTVVHIFGFDDAEALVLADQCGFAFQLTNIMRDVAEDWQNGRLYLPLEDLAQFGVGPGDIGAGVPTERFRALMRYEAQRARQHYDASWRLIAMVNRDSRGCLWALMQIYSRLLERIEQSGYDVLSRRIRVSAVEKSWILLRAVLARGSFNAANKKGGAEAPPLTS